MPFGEESSVGRWVYTVLDVGGDSRRGRGSLGVNLGRPIVTSGDFVAYIVVREWRALPKLFWEHLFNVIFLSLSTSTCHLVQAKIAPHIIHGRDWLFLRLIYNIHSWNRHRRVKIYTATVGYLFFPIRQFCVPGINYRDSFPKQSSPSHPPDCLSEPRDLRFFTCVDFSQRRIRYGACPSVLLVILAVCIKMAEHASKLLHHLL